MMGSGWINVLSNMAYGIYVLTTCDSDLINGMIASWVSQVSFAPPLLMAAVHPDRLTHKLILKTKKFAINILAKDQKNYLKRFKGADPSLKFKDIRWKNGLTGCPIILDCVGYLECELKDFYKPGNHTLFVGEIIEAGLFSDREVLTTLDYEGVYLGRA